MALNRNAVELTGVTIPVTDLRYNIFIPESYTQSKTWLENWLTNVPPIRLGNIVTDELLGINMPLSVKFVSTRDVDDWQRNKGMSSILAYYNVKEAAQILADRTPGLVLFYDPIARPDVMHLLAMEREEGENEEDFRARRNVAFNEAEQMARAESEQLLRKQAEAFIAWLHSQTLLMD